MLNEMQPRERDREREEENEKGEGETDRKTEFSTSEHSNIHAPAKPNLASSMPLLTLVVSTTAPLSTRSPRDQRLLTVILIPANSNQRSLKIPLPIYRARDKTDHMMDK